jgi:hypothetical protein
MVAVQQSKYNSYQVDHQYAHHQKSVDIPSSRYPPKNKYLTYVLKFGDHGLRNA